ncbi:hypothetical protein [Acetonema longum]|uniref:Uncharacterized protein n=1 Tax=Acetonema longum DSM 6540 TaxID=1009370 RepID=F7NK96_9FIRM|nr:hypothetical protein [Acetonema longum]EGO63537.1 hypothetical protein ALO_12546 [Acetonema longum DSM 6540]
MIEIIERSCYNETFGTEKLPIAKVEKMEINGLRVQASYNSDGHLVVRALQGKGSDGYPNDTLVVFDQAASDVIISFCRTIGINEQFVNLVAKHATQLPF